MGSLMFVQVDELGGFFDGLESSFFNGGWGSDHGDDSTVMIKVRVAVKDLHALDRKDRSQDRLLHFGAAGIRIVRNTFNQWIRHETLDK